MPKLWKTYISRIVVKCISLHESEKPTGGNPKNMKFLHGWSPRTLWLANIISLSMTFREAMLSGFLPLLWYSDATNSDACQQSLVKFPVKFCKCLKIGRYNEG